MTHKEGQESDLRAARIRGGKPKGGGGGQKKTQESTKDQHGPEGKAGSSGENRIISTSAPTD